MRWHKPFISTTCTRPTESLKAALSSAFFRIRTNPSGRFHCDDFSRRQGVSLLKRPTQAVLGISISTLHSPRTKAEGRYHWLLCPCHSLSPSIHDTEPSCYAETIHGEPQVVSNKLGNNSWAPGTPVKSLVCKTQRTSYHEKDLQKAVSFSLVMTSG